METPRDIARIVLGLDPDPEDPKSVMGIEHQAIKLAQMVLAEAEGPCGSPLRVKRSATIYAICELPAGHKPKAHRSGNTTWNDKTIQNRDEVREMSVENPTREELEETQRVLQTAHDYIEVAGFDITTFSEREEGGPRCWVGNIRAAAGATASPSGGRYEDGDGIALPLALSILDELALALLPSLVEDFNPHDAPQRGRYIESHGFHKARGDQTEYALPILRKALTRVYEQIEALDA